MFIGAGDELASVGAVLAQLRGLAEELEGLTSSQAMLDAFGSFREAIAALAEEDAAGDWLTSLSQLADTTAALRASCGDFRRLLRSLAFLSTAARVESARLGQLGSGFATLAAEMGAIVLRMEESLAQAEPAAREMDQETRLAGSRAAGATHAGAASSGHAVRGLAASLERMDGLKAELGAGAAALAAAISGIAARMHGVMEMLQVHDIVRQKLEHAQAILLETLDDAAWQEDAEGGLLLAHVCGLQARQLQEGARLLTEAVRGVEAGLDAMAGELAEAGACVGQPRPGSALQGLENLIAQARDAAADARTSGGFRLELRAVLAHIAQAVAPLQQQFSSFGAMRADIQMLSLNAGIHAARTGSSGMALGAIATEIQRLAGSSSLLIDRNDASLAAIGRLAGGLAQADGGDAAAALALDGRIDALRAMRDGIAALTDRLVSEAQGLAAAIRRKAAGLGRCDAALRRLEDSRAVLDDIASRLTRAAGSATLDPRRIEALMGRYTMASERRIHSLHVSGHAGGHPAAAPADAGIEFF